MQIKDLATALRILSVDSVELAQSGHPGMPLGMAEIATVLWRLHLKHNPNNPQWVNRDRFVLSNGHGAVLLYSLLHLTGYNLSISDLQQFRKLNSHTPGHPEYRHTVGVETSTGPLGQGLANAVGMAISEHLLAYEFNKPEFKIIDHYTYVFVGDGCLMEGISHEVCSLAGTMQLSKLIVIYDKNNISIDGNTDAWFNENVAARFAAYGFYVIDNIDGHDIHAVDMAIKQAKNNLHQPKLLICRTEIGKGSPNKVNTADVHGSPLGFIEVALLRKNLDWQYEPFVIPQNIYNDFSCTAVGANLEHEWQQLFQRYQATFPEHAAELIRRLQHKLPDNWQQIMTSGAQQAVNWPNNIATRKSSQLAIEYFAQYLPELFGGSADLSHSNLTIWNNARTLNKISEFKGNYLSYGVREFGMSAIMNGIYLYGGLKPFGGTFLVFVDYAKNALRMASIMHIAPIFIYTHDSIWLGEDGPTHQPIEQLSELRLIPNMHVWRPANNLETLIAWGNAISRTDGPTSLVFSRQSFKHIENNCNPDDILRGGYTFDRAHSGDQSRTVVIIATGSELSLAHKVYEKLCNYFNALNDGYDVRLVSMPSTSKFDEQCVDYRQSIIPQYAKKIVIEAGATALWYKYINDGLIIGIDQFGASAPNDALVNAFGFTIDGILKQVLDFIYNER